MTTIRAKPTTKKASAPGNETPDTQAPVKKLQFGSPKKVSFWLRSTESKTLIC